MEADETRYILFERIAYRDTVATLHTLAQEMAMEIESQAPDAFRAKSVLRRWSRRLHEEADYLEETMPDFPYIEPKGS